MDEKVLTLYFIRGDPMSFQIRKISSEFYFQVSATYSYVTWRLEVLFILDSIIDIQYNLYFILIIIIIIMLYWYLNQRCNRSVCH